MLYVGQAPYIENYYITKNGEWRINKNPTLKKVSIIMLWVDSEISKLYQEEVLACGRNLGVNWEKL